MRRKRNSLDVIKWNMEHIYLCSLCNEKAEYRLNFWAGLNHGTENLCEKHAKEWNKGELYL